MNVELLNNVIVQTDDGIIFVVWIKDITKFQDRGMTVQLSNDVDICNVELDRHKYFITLKGDRYETYYFDIQEFKKEKLNLKKSLDFIYNELTEKHHSDSGYPYSV